MAKKERSNILCPFCGKPLYFKRVSIDTDSDPIVAKYYWCRCRQYRQAMRLTDRFIKFRDKAHEKRYRMVRKFQNIVNSSEVRGLFVFDSSKNYATYNFLGIMDDRDMAMWNKGGL